MSQIIIDIGATPDDSLGTPLRQAFADVNQMFTEVYRSGPVDSTVRIANNVITTTVINSNLILSPSGIGKVQVNNSIQPSINDVYDLGSSTQRFNTVYIGSGGIDLLGNLTLSSNIVTTGNVVGEYFIGNGSLLTGVSVDATRIINGSSDVSISQPNGPVTFNVNGVGNIIVVDQNSVTIAGNLTVDGNVKYINVENLNVRDPIIGLGRGPNNTPLTSNDGFDRGSQLWYFDTQERSAFFGYDNSTGQLFAAVDVSVANEIATVNSYGTIVLGNINSTEIVSTGNITAEYFIGNATSLTGVMADRGTEPNSNWNNITEMGIYTVNRTSWTGTQNTPIDSQVFVGMLEVKNSTGLAITQTFWPGTVNTANVKLMWVRNYWDGTWTAWQRMINGSQIIDGGDQF
jgi:hypothetical protein